MGFERISVQTRGMMTYTQLFSLQAPETRFITNLARSIAAQLVNGRQPRRTGAEDGRGVAGRGGEGARAPGYSHVRVEHVE